MATELEKLIEMFNSTFEGYTLSPSKATEWLADYGYEAAVSAVKITAERPRENPLVYAFAVLRKSGKKGAKALPHLGFDSALRERYLTYVESGDLTADDMKLLISARMGNKVDTDAFSQAEYHLRRAVYPKSISRLPEGMTYWEKRAWAERTEEQRQFLRLNELRLEAAACQAKWANSEEFEKMKGGDFDVVANWARES